MKSPDQLDQYLRVVGPSVWLILTAVILLLAGMMLWSSAAFIESCADGTAVVEGGRMRITFENAEEAERVEAGMTIKTGSVISTVKYAGYAPDGTVFASADTSLEDGLYEVRVVYSRMRILQLLIN